MSLAREVLNMLNLMIEQSSIMKFWREPPEQQRETDYSCVLSTECVARKM